MRSFLPWWGPIVLAIYAGYMLWVFFYPIRYVYAVTDGTCVQFPDIQEGAIWVSVIALIIFYILWFALPYPGTELLFDIFSLPWLGIYMLYGVVMPAMECFYRSGEWGKDHENRLKSGMTYPEWEMYKEQRKKLKTRLEQEELTAWVRAHSQETSEEEAEKAAYDKRSRFKVIPGKRKRR